MEIFFEKVNYGKIFLITLQWKHETRQQRSYHWAIILLEEVLGKKVFAKTWRIFAPLTPFPWQLVPPAHGITADQAQFWARYNFYTPPPGFIKNIFAFRSFCSKISCFFNIFSTSDHLFKDLKAVHGILAHEKQQTDIKTPMAQLTGKYFTYYWYAFVFNF